MLYQFAAVKPVPRWCCFLAGKERESAALCWLPVVSEHIKFCTLCWPEFSMLWNYSVELSHTVVCVWFWNVVVILWLNSFLIVCNCIAYPVYHVTGVWGIGVATRNCDVQKVPLGCDVDSWVLRHDGTLCHNDAEVCRISPLPEEGDVLVRITSTVLVIMKCWDHRCVVIDHWMAIDP